jgi:predicted AAA+ superfamily ATPase
MFDRLLSIPSDTDHSLFLFGPRGTGKTSWLRRHFADAIHLDLLNDDIYSELLARPHRLVSRIPPDYTGWVVIDEVQKIPALLNEVHRLIEERGQRFILTGSSARSLRRRGVNLLAGRAVTLAMHPLTTPELGDAFDLQTALRLGMLPSVTSHSQPEKYLGSYISTYLKEEVQQEGVTRNLPLFSRFLEVASFSQGEVLNYSEIAREIAGKRHTMANFFEILEDLLIAVRIPVFRKRAKRNLISHPKFYFFDVGVFRSLRPRGPLDSAEEAEGAALETLFLQQARALNDYYDWGYEIFYWRTRNGAEVDFVLYGPRGLHAFEIKRKQNLSGKDFKGLKLFGDDYEPATLHMLYGGPEPRLEGRIQVHPFEQALCDLARILGPDAD